MQTYDIRPRLAKPNRNVMFLAWCLPLSFTLKLPFKVKKKRVYIIRYAKNVEQFKWQWHYDKCVLPVEHCESSSITWTMAWINITKQLINNSEISIESINLVSFPSSLLSNLSEYWSVNMWFVVLFIHSPYVLLPMICPPYISFLYLLL